MARKKAIQGRSKKTNARRELDRETSKILRLKEAIARNFWDLGSCLVRVHDKKLYQSSVHQSFEEYLSKEVKISRATAYRLMELARKFSRETALKFGQTKLLGAIAYAKATPEQDRPLDVTRYEIEVKDHSGKKSTKSFDQATTREINRAAALLRKRAQAALPPAGPQLPSLADLLSGKKPKIHIATYVSKVREKLKSITPRPKFSVTTIKKGDDPLVDLKLSSVRASKLMEALGYLTSSVMEVWLESMK